MNRTVHYMIRKPGARGELIYPSELNTSDDYYGFGSFFLGGHDHSDVCEVYGFWAIRQGRAIETKLVLQSSNAFRATVDGVGKFDFRAKKVTIPARYTGDHRGFTDGLLIRQLAPFDHDTLDKAALENDFFFVGFTPKLDMNR